MTPSSRSDRQSWQRGVAALTLAAIVAALLVVACASDHERTQEQLTAIEEKLDHALKEDAQAAQQVQSVESEGHSEEARGADGDQLTPTRPDVIEHPESDQVVIWHALARLHAMSLNLTVELRLISRLAQSEEWSAEVLPMPWTLSRQDAMSLAYQRVWFSAISVRVWIEESQELPAEVSEALEPTLDQLQDSLKGVAISLNDEDGASLQEHIQRAIRTLEVLDMAIERHLERLGGRYGAGGMPSALTIDLLLTRLRESLRRNCWAWNCQGDDRAGRMSSTEQLTLHYTNAEFDVLSRRVAGIAREHYDDVGCATWRRASLLAFQASASAWHAYAEHKTATLDIGPVVVDGSVRHDLQPRLAGMLATIQWLELTLAYCTLTST